MKCLRKFKWIKVRRNYLPMGKGIMVYWSRLASKAAFRKGKGLYCGHWNQVTPGMWSGGIVGLKSILGVKRRNQALQIMNELQELGYIEYSLDRRSKHLKYMITEIRSLQDMPQRYPFFNEAFIPANKYHKLYIENWYLVLYQIKDETVYVDWIVDCRQDYQWLIK